MITREIECKHEWMRWQVGYTEMKDEMCPICFGKKQVAERPLGTQAPVFHLLGWGYTLPEAQRMAEASVKGQHGHMDARTTQSV